MRLIHGDYGYEEIKNRTLQRTLNRFKTKGIIKHKKTHWEVTIEGKEFMKIKNKGLRNFFPKTKSSAFKKVKSEVLVLFDIPEKERYKRDWLRSELVGFGFESIQRSVWFGPKLPKEFLEYLIEQKIKQYVHMFKVSKDVFQ